MLIVGASTRAAAFSALRAGLQPWCADRFRDADLQARCTTLALPSGHDARGLLRAARQAPPGPWMYTGALENRPAQVRRLARLRPLWGNNAPALDIIRSPQAVADLLCRADIPRPAVALRPADCSRPGRWLRKPLAGAGGSGITFLTEADSAPPRRPMYYQEYIEGEACAAVYLGDGTRARLLGATHQLVGVPWLHAAPFHYCGSIGPLPLSDSLRQALAKVGTVLVQGSGLRGLFGVDFVLRDGVPWPVEVNPRYSASVEVLEYGGGLPALALHRSMFDPAAPAVPAPVGLPATGWVGKAVLFARAPRIFPADGPWHAALRQPDPVHVLPAFADIPPAGQAIPQGGPILTLFCRGESLAACLATLRASATDLNQYLFGC